MHSSVLTDDARMQLLAAAPEMWLVTFGDSWALAQLRAIHAPNTVMRPKSEKDGLDRALASLCG